MNSSITYIDLFAGASGLSEGFVRCGMTPVGHIEANTDASTTIKTRTAYHYLKQVNNLKDYNKYLTGEIDRNTLYSLVPKHLLDTVINAEIKKENLDQLFMSIDNSLKHHNRKTVDLIIGGPPCQAYSLIGRHRKDLADDPRNTLYLLYGRFLKYYQPKAFVFENVPGILSAGNSLYFDNLCRYYRKLGYEIHAEILNASDYGVLQDRRRVIIVGWQKEFDSGFPYPKAIQHKWDTENVFSDLPKLLAGEGKFYDRYRKKTNDYLNSFELRNGIDTVTHHMAAQ
jgi:DNA (cytosine-5)-methyltransferase 1